METRDSGEEDRVAQPEQQGLRAFCDLVRLILDKTKSWLARESTPTSVRTVFYQAQGAATWHAEPKPDYVQLLVHHSSEIEVLPEIERLTEELLSDGVMRHQAFDSDTGRPIASSWRVALMNQLYPVLAHLIEKEGLQPSDGSIRDAYDWLTKRDSVVFAPVLNFESNFSGGHLGEALTLEPFTAESKNGLWLDLFPGGLQSIEEFSAARFVLRRALPNTQLDVTAEVYRAITSLRLYKEGVVAAPVCHLRSRIPSSGGSAYVLSECAARRWVPYPIYDLQEAEWSKVASIYDQLSKAESAKTLQRLETPLRRFNQAYSRESPQDRIIDCCIALEASLLAGVKDELRYRLSMRGAALLAGSCDPRGTKSLLQKIYDVRSQIVHEGSSVADASRTKGGWSHFSIVQLCEGITRSVLSAYLQRLSKGQSIKEVNNELEDRLIVHLAGR